MGNEGGSTLWRTGVPTGLLLLALLIPGAPLEAQRAGGPGRAELERRVQLRFMQQVQSELGLDSIQSRRLLERTRSFQEERVLLHARERTLRARYAEALLQIRRAHEGGGESSMTQDEARALLDELIDIRAAEVDLMRQEQEALLEILDPDQLLFLYRMREEFAERIRSMRGGPPGPGGGGGPPNGSEGALGAGFGVPAGPLGSELLN